MDYDVEYLRKTLERLTARKNIEERNARRYGTNWCSQQWETHRKGITHFMEQIAYHEEQLANLG